jgi:hypothetical protein
VIFLLEDPTTDTSNHSSHFPESHWPPAIPTLELPRADWDDQASPLSVWDASDAYWLKVIPTLELPMDYGAAEPQEPPADAGGHGAGRHTDDQSEKMLAKDASAAAADSAEHADSSEHADAPASCQLPKPHGGGPHRRPPGMDQDRLLRLLAEAYGQMMFARGGPRGQHSEEELDDWLRQLREVALRGDGDTVLALFSALRAQHPWVRLSDVYSALVQLRGMHMGQ